MASKVQHAANYWTSDVRMTSKVQPAADYCTVDWEDQGTRLCYFWWAEKKEGNGETPLRTGEDFEWIIKQLLNTAFVGYEQFCRSQRAITTEAEWPSASVDNTLLDLQNSSYPTRPHAIISKYLLLVYTTQENSTFRALWLASSEVISQVLFTSELPKKNKMAFVGTFSQIKLLFRPLVIQLVWYIIKQLFTSVSVKVVDINLAASRLGKYLPLFTSTSVNNC